MKHAIAFSAILLLGASLASAQAGPSRRYSNRLFTDVVEMTRAGLSDATIVAYVNARRARLESDVNAGDLIRLRQAGVSEAVVGHIAGIAGIDAGQSRPDGDVAYGAGDATGYPVDPSYSEDEAYPYAYPYAYGNPYWYGYGYGGYPYWYGYGPYFSTGFIVGGRSFHGGGSGHHGGGGHGGHRGHGGGHSGGGHGGGGHGGRGHGGGGHGGGHGGGGHGGGGHGGGGHGGGRH